MKTMNKNHGNLSFLGGDFGKEVLGKIKSRYKNFNIVSGAGRYNEHFIPEVPSYPVNPFIDLKTAKKPILVHRGEPSIPAKTVMGSNPFYVVAVNEIIRSEGLRTATQADLEKEIKRNSNFSLENIGVDTGIIVMPDECSSDLEHSYLHKYLKEQLKERSEIRLPIMIPLAGLDLEKNSSAPYELAFKLRDDAKLIYDPILNSGRFRSFLREDMDEKIGLPTKLTAEKERCTPDLNEEGGEREISFGEIGLQRVFTVGKYFKFRATSNLEGHLRCGRVAIVK